MTLRRAELREGADEACGLARGSAEVGRWPAGPGLAGTPGGHALGRAAPRLSREAAWTRGTSSRAPPRGHSAPTPPPGCSAGLSRLGAGGAERVRPERHVGFTRGRCEPLGLSEAPFSP